MEHERRVNDGLLGVWRGAKRHGAMLGLVAVVMLMAGCGYPNDWKHGYQDNDRLALADAPTGNRAAEETVAP